MVKKKTIVGIVTVASALALSGCSSEEAHYSGYRKHDVDQIFRDHSGYRTYHVSALDIVTENEYCVTRKRFQAKLPKDIPEKIKKHFNFIDTGYTPGVIITKDLKSGTQGFANIIHYSPKTKFDDWINWESHCKQISNTVTHVEIHLPKDQNLSPGNETYGGKNPIHSPMQEVK